MPFDGAMAEEELLADLRVREAVVSQASDLRFLRRERLVGIAVRLRTVSPVASSSRCARSANASAPSRRTRRRPL